jgi:hypothetical protein
VGVQPIGAATDAIARARRVCRLAVQRQSSVVAHEQHADLWKLSYSRTSISLSSSSILIDSISPEQAAATVASKLALHDAIIAEEGMKLQDPEAKSLVSLAAWHTSASW